MAASSSSSKAEEHSKILRRVQLDDKEVMGMSTEQLTHSWHSQMQYVDLLEKVAACSSNDEEVQTHLQSVDKEIQQLKSDLQRLREDRGGQNAPEEDPLAVQQQQQSGGSLSEPCANLLVHRLSCGLAHRHTRVDTLSAEVQAWKLTTSDGCTVDEKKAMAKCRLLAMENCELGDRVSDSRLSHLRAQAEQHKAVATRILQHESTAMDCLAKELEWDMVTMQGTLMLLYQALRVKGKLSADLLHTLSLSTPRPGGCPPPRSGAAAAAQKKKRLLNKCMCCATSSAAPCNNVSQCRRQSFDTPTKPPTDASITNNGSSLLNSCGGKRGGEQSPPTVVSSCQHVSHAPTPTPALSSTTCGSTSARDDTNRTAAANASSAAAESPPQCAPKCKKSKLISTTPSTETGAVTEWKGGVAATESSISNGVGHCWPDVTEGVPRLWLAASASASLQPTCNSEGGDRLNTTTTTAPQRASKEPQLDEDESSLEMRRTSSKRHGQNSRLTHGHTTVMNGGATLSST